MKRQSKRKKDKKKFIAMLVASVSIMSFLTFKTTVSILKDYERQDNVITIGNVALEIEESHFPTATPILSAGSRIPKDPVVKNTGSNDEYVFLKVSIPKRNVTLLYEENATSPSSERRGTPAYSSAPALEEIFKTIVEPSTQGDKILISGESDDPGLKRVINYRKGDSDTSTAGWVFLGKIDNVSSTGGTTDDYYFGYNKRLLPKDGVDGQTNALFDYVQLKSFIEGELSSGTTANVNVTVTAYGVQADELGIGGLPSGTGILTDDKVERIFAVVKNKQGITDTLTK